MTEQETLQGRLGLYIAAEAAILSAGQEYTIGQGSTARRLTRADLTEVRDEIRKLTGQLAVLTTATVRPRGVFYLRPFG